MPEAAEVGGRSRVLGAITGPLARRAVTRALEKDLADIAAAAERS